MAKISGKRILAKATEILTRQNKRGLGWTKDTLARDVHGHPAGLESPSACRFCADGAIERAGFELGVGHGSAAVWDAKSRLRSVMEDIVTNNDHPKTSFPQVLLAFDLAQTGAGVLK